MGIVISSFIIFFQFTFIYYFLLYKLLYVCLYFEQELNIFKLINVFTLLFILICNRFSNNCLCLMKVYSFIYRIT